MKADIYKKINMPINTLHFDKLMVQIVESTVKILKELKYVSLYTSEFTTFSLKIGKLNNISIICV